MTYLNRFMSEYQQLSSCFYLRISLVSQSIKTSQMKGVYIYITIIFIIVFCLSPAQAKKNRRKGLPETYTFQEYEAQFEKSYKDQNQRGKHMKAFQQHLKELRKLNKESKGKDKMTFGLNDLLDMTPEEHDAFFAMGKFFEDLVNSGVEEEKQDGKRESKNPRNLQNTNFPSRLDYRDFGWVSSPKGQKNCGSCWNFAGHAVIESLLMRDKGYEVDVAEQVGLQCTVRGCNGGWAYFVFEEFMAHGVPLQSQFPYRPHETSNDTCLYDQWETTQTLETNTSALKMIKELYYYPRSTTEQLKYYLLNYGTVAVTLKAGGTPFMGYKSGVIVCDPSITGIDHEVQLIGWNDNDGEDGAWIIKNSWSSGWGEDGFARISMNESQNCLLGRTVQLIYADFPNPIIVKKDYNLQLTTQAGDGWNQNRITIVQQDMPSQVFGEQFFTGSVFTQQIQVVVGRTAQVVFAIKGSRSLKIGVKITDLNGNIICEKKPGYYLNEGFSICEFCPDCGEVQTTPLTYQLLSDLVDQSGNKLGYNGTQLGFIFNGKTITVGSDFTSGSETQEIQFQWDIGSSIQVVGVTSPESVDTRLVGFKFSDMQGNVLNRRNPSVDKSPIQEGKNVNIFLPEPEYSPTILSNTASTPSISEKDEEKTQKMSSDKSLIIVIVILSILLLILAVVSFILFIRLRKSQTTKNPAQIPVSVASSASDLRSE